MYLTSVQRIILLSTRDFVELTLRFLRNLFPFTCPPPSLLNWVTQKGLLFTLKRLSAKDRPFPLFTFGYPLDILIEAFPVCQGIFLGLRGENLLPDSSLESSTEVVL